MSAQIPEGSVVITPAQMYLELRDTHDEVRNLSSAVQSMAEKLTERHQVESAQYSDHERRIRSLEWRMYVATGAAAAIGAGGASVLTKILGG